MATRNSKYLRSWREAADEAARAALRPLSPLEVERVCDWVTRHLGKGLGARLRRSKRANHPDAALGLIGRSYGLRFSDPQQSLRLAEAAVQVAQALRLSSSFAAVEADLRAQVWANYANSLRIVDRLEEAEQAFLRAEGHLSRGSSDRVLRAEVSLRKVGLLLRQKAYDAALLLTAEAIDLHDRCDEPHLAAKARVLYGHVCQLASQPALGIDPLDRASKDLDYDAEPEVGFALVHNTILCLDAAGRSAEALAGSRAARALYDEIAPPLMRLRAMWLRGRLLLNHGSPDLAEVELEEARAGFLRHGLVVDAAFASLELALALAQQNEHARVARLAEEMYPTFQARQIPGEAAAVLLLFAEACRANRASAEALARWVAILEPLRLSHERGQLLAANTSP